MPIRRHAGPVGGAQAIGQALRDLEGPAVADAALGGASVNLSQPLPVYRLGLDDIEGQEFLDHAKQVGWRYLLDRAGRLAYADLADSGEGSHAFASLARNANAVRLNEAAHLAEHVAGALADCEVRILDIPALHISAIWLAGSEPAFIPYIDPDSMPGHRDISVDQDFVPRVSERASALRSHFEPPQAYPSAG